MHNLVEFLEEACRTKGDCAAVEDEDCMLNYAELRSLSLTICRYIIQRRVGHCEKKMIAVYLPKSAKCLCALLGILYSGNVYVPMDCRAPVNRTKLILEIIQPALIITDKNGFKLLSESGIDEGLLCEYDDIAEPSRTSGTDHIEETLSRMQDVDPAYVLFTSGSTGVPKGVVIPHRRVINYISWAREFFSITGSEVIGSQAPFYFTVSAMDIYLSISTGSKLCIIPENLFSRADKLLRYMADKEVSLIFWVSSAYHHIAQSGALENDADLSLRHAWFVGEPMAIPSLQYWMDRLPEVEFVNLYGATETDMTICYQVPGSQMIEGSVPLGRPCANTEILLLKDDGSAAGPGEIGEICVRGSCLALGYFKDIEKTRSSFVQNPLHNDYPDTIYRTGDLGEIDDGLILFHGRRDHQFKHLGYRIEAGEIEAVAGRFPGVRNACVIYDGAKRQIVMFYESGGQVDELLFRRALMADLPVYMVPTRFVKLEDMPFNANSKKDRITLKTRYID